MEEWLMILRVTKGNMHNFLGIKIRYLKNRRAAINIKE